MSNSSKFLKSRAVAVVIAIFALVASTLTASPASAATHHSVNAGQEYNVVIGDSFEKSFLCTADNGEVMTGTNYLQGTIPTGMTWNTGVLSGVATELGDYTFGDWQCLFDIGGQGYQSVGGSENWVTIHVIPPFTPTPSITVTPLNNPSCDIRIVGRFPKTPDAGTASLMLAITDTFWTATLTGFGADSLVDITVSASDVTTLAQNPNVSSLTGAMAEIPNLCDKDITATLGYQYAGAPAAIAQATVHATKILANAQMSAFVEPNTFCSVRLIGSFTSIAPGTNFPIFIGQSGAGYIVYLSPLNEGEMYDVVLPLDDMAQTSSDPAIASYEIWGSGVPACDGAEIGIVATVRMRDGSIASSELARLFLGSPLACEPGTWSEDGFVPCADAAPGYFVDRAGATNQTPCNIGFFADTARSLFCTPAAVGRYVANTGATTSVACPAGLTTYLPASRSIHECYKLRPQTVKGVKVLKTYKYGATVITPMLTDGGRPLSVVATGKCTVRVTQITIKVKGKNTKVNRYQIVASKSAGNCSVTYTNAGDSTYAPLRVVKTFKVSKTGK